MGTQNSGNFSEQSYDRPLLEVGTRIPEAVSWSFSGPEFGAMSEDEKQRVAEHIKELNLIRES